MFSACLSERDMDMWLKPFRLRHSESVIRAICSLTWLYGSSPWGLVFGSGFLLLQLLLKQVV